MNIVPAVAMSLLAETTYLEGFGSSFRGDNARITSNDFTTGLLILCAVAAGVWLLVRVRRRQEEAGRINSPRRLFGELCRAHHLNRSQRRLVRRVARFHQLAHPAQIFVEPQLLNPTRLDTSLRDEAARLAEVYQVLVGAGDPHGGSTRQQVAGR